MATKEKRLEAGTVGSRTPSTEIEAASKRRRKGRKEVTGRAREGGREGATQREEESCEERWENFHVPGVMCSRH